MLTKEKILKIVEKNGILKTNDIVLTFRVSRQYANRLIKDLVIERKLLKVGLASKAMYVSLGYAKKHPEILNCKITKTFVNKNLEEHIVLNIVESELPLILKQKENIRNIFTFAFSEMLNNAIEHSSSAKIKIDVLFAEKMFIFTIADFGVGVFRNVMKKRNLKSELEAIQDILKGKVTTMPELHSGQGIFFTSRSGDEFILESYGYRLIVNNQINDVFLEEISGSKMKKGTKVTFKLSVDSKKHLKEIFDEFSNIDKENEFGFDKTEIKIKLYLKSGIHISRSQARRVLSGLEKFKIVVFDFDKVPMIGQSFADEIFRVFQSKHPKIQIEAINMNEAVRFMIDRVE